MTRRPEQQQATARKGDTITMSLLLRSSLFRRLVVGFIAAMTPFVVAASMAEAAAPVWDGTIASHPTNLVPGVGNQEYFLSVTNIGSVPADGAVTPITITDTLPAGLTPTIADYAAALQGGEFFPCALAGQTVTCSIPGLIRPGETIAVSIFLEVTAADPSTLTDAVAVSGGGAQSLSFSTQTTIGSTPAPFDFLDGRNGLGARLTDADGQPVTQAGAHPDQLTIDLGFPDVDLGDLGGGVTRFVGAGGGLRDLSTALPRGLVVDPSATPVRCTEAELESDVNGGGCPAVSQVGLAHIAFTLFGGGTFDASGSPLYNMVSPPGSPAEFGFDIGGLGIYVHLAGGVRGSDYALTADAHDILARSGAAVLALRVELWGDPSASSHDFERGLGCIGGSGTCPAPVTPRTTPFLTLPSVCAPSLALDGGADSWQSPSTVITRTAQVTDANGNPTPVSGCDKLAFTPSVHVQPTTQQADSSSGLNFDLSVPQPRDLNALAEANLKTAVVTLPAGMSVNPSAANGLKGCSEAQIGLGNKSEPSCPDGSRIGSVEITTPLLPDTLTGSVYLAQQGNLPGNGSNPFGSLLAIYVTAEADGALIKLAGHVVADPLTGQLQATFDNNPQLPFSDFKIDFFGGSRATLATPDACGTYQTTSSLAPWSGTPAVLSSDSFTIGSGCVNGFAPAFTAGTVNQQAGAFSPFALSLSRSDTDQELSGLSVKLPPGMLAKLAGVQQCTDQQLAVAAANTGAAEQASPSCPAGSQVGSVETGAGTGSSPFFLPGKAYLTGPYKGAPYGLAVVVPALAGPIDLGAVVVRVALFIDPATAQVTAVSDPLPTILAGIPLRLRRIDVTLDQPQFTFTPTSCEPQAVTATLSSTGGLTAAGSSHFQVGGCSGLSFKPKFTAKTQGNGSFGGNGASLAVSLTTGGGPSSGEANLKFVEVQLPAQLPARLSTLQQACTEGQFAANPAGCPAASVVGTAVVHTPILPAPLQGPVYVVSRGGAAFPNLVIVLQGAGITIELVGHTQISKRGLTFSRFETVPDAPVSSFDLTLPEGPHSVLAANGKLCAAKTVTVRKRVTRRVHGRLVHTFKKIKRHVAGTLAMPTRLVAQSGAVITQTTRVPVTGCGSAKSTRRAASRAKTAQAKRG